MFEQARAAAPKFDFVPAFDGTDEFACVKALTYEGMPYEGKPTRVFAYYGCPEGAKNVPAMVLIHGGGGHAYACWVKMWMEKGFAAIAMDTTGYFPISDQAGREEGRRELWSRTPDNGLLPEGYAQAPDNCEMRDCDKPVGDQWMYHAISDAILARNLIASMPGVDGERVGVTGISWGGVITSLLIGREPRFAFAVPVYGSGYMADSLGFCGPFFQDEKVKAQWLAEDRFSEVRMPVLWHGWNADTAFSIDGNSRSYLDTKDANPLTAFSAVDSMLHSHYHSWIRPEPYRYARMALGLEKMPERPEARLEDGVVTVKAPGAKSLRLFWIDAPMTYSKHFYALCGVDMLWQDQPWNTLPMEGNKIRLPEGAAGWYVEAVYEPEFVLCTPYRTI